MNRLDRLTARVATSLFLFCSVGFPIPVSADGWVPLITVHPQGILDDKYPYLTTDGDGNAWVVWMGTDPSLGDQEAYSARWTGTNWGEYGTVNPPNNIDDLIPRASRANDGTMWVIWKVPDLAHPPTYLGVVSRRTASGWTAPDTVWANGGRQDSYDLAAMTIDDAWIVRDGVANSGDSDIWAYHMTSGGVGPAVAFEDPDSIDLNPQVAIDGQGEPWITWMKIPPLSPNRSRVAVARRAGGVWLPPQSLPLPQEINRNLLLVDQDDVPWIVTIGADPASCQFCTAVWALRRQGGEWLAPTRISNPVATSDSILYQLSVPWDSQQPARAVWIQGNVFDITRRDVVMSSWDGVQWGPVELVGDIADSTSPSWPTISSDGEGRVWVAYGRYQAATNRSEIVTTYKPLVPTSANNFEMSATVEGDGIFLRWTVTGIRSATTLAVLRTRVRSDSDGAAEAVRVHEVPLSQGDDSGRWLDRQAPCGEQLSYRLEVRTSEGAIVRGRAQTVIAPPCGLPGLDRIVPNPATGDVEVRGYLYGRQTALVDIFDIAGRLVVSIPISVSGSTPNQASSTWNGQTSDGKAAPSGIYFARLRSGGKNSAPKRIVLLKP